MELLSPMVTAVYEHRTILIYCNPSKLKLSFNAILPESKAENYAIVKCI